MKILFISTWYPANIDRWLSSAFEDEGHEVIRVGKTYFGHYGIEWEKELLPIITQEIESTASINLPALVDKYVPDILLFWDWVNCPIDNIGETLKLKEKLPFIVVEHEGWPQNLERGRSLNPTVYYTGMPYGVFGHPANGFEMGYKYLPGAYYPKYHQLLDSEFNSRNLDCILLAGMYNPRLKICEELKKMGINIIYGQKGIVDYQIYHNLSKCTWEFSGGQEYIKWRVFEAMAMGCLVLTDRIKLMDMLGMENGKHYIEYESIRLEDGRQSPDVQDLYNKIMFFRTHKETWEFITQSAFEFIKDVHNYRSRVEMILRDIRY